MSTTIRRAQIEDAAAFVRIKDQLPLPLADGGTTTGGFLLGTNLDTYRHYIKDAYCLVATGEQGVVGFGILLPDPLLRESEVWQKRDHAAWYIDLPVYEKQNLCYFEQLAFLPGHRKTVLKLSYNLIKWAFDAGHHALFTTTVNKPVRNLAALPFIKAAGGIHAGNIDEVYPSIGPINSDIYLMLSGVFFQKARAHTLYPVFKS
ncbi:MAG: hypothetical protein HUU01_13350 [Saprospiraceae bacterium]|nr:hypothetical protein [Saprospiraceae bacterium]